MAANNCVNLCINWASGRYNNGSCLTDTTILHLDNHSGAFKSSRYIVSAIALLCYSYCLYFYLLRLKAKSSMRLIAKDYLDFFYIFVGCLSMVLLYVFEIIYNSKYQFFPCRTTALAWLEIAHAIADCAFMMSNASASFRLMSVSFKLVSGFGKASQEKFKRLFLFVAILIFASAFVSMIAIIRYGVPYVQKGALCGDTFFFLANVLMNWEGGKWAYCVRFGAILVSVFVHLSSFYVALRNFDSRPVQTTSRPFLQKPSDSVMKFGRWRRILVLSSTLFTAISWLLLNFLVFLPQILDEANDVIKCENCNPHKNTSASDASRAFYDRCSDNVNYPWSSLSLMIMLSPAAAIIRVVAYPICSMVATRSFESGANRKKMEDSLKTLSMRVVHKADGAAAFRLGQNSRFSADDWNVAATNA
jgi:hypothetical protein